MQRTRAPSRHPMCECVTHSRQSHSAQAPRGEGASPASATASGARRLPQQHYTMCYSRRVTQSAVCYGLCGVLCSCELCYAVRVYLHVVFWLLCYACIILRVIIIIISPSPHLMLALHSPVQYYNSQRHGYIHSTYVVMRSITRDGCCGNSAQWRHQGWRRRRRWIRHRRRRRSRSEGCLRAGGLVRDPLGGGCGG